ncbi:MAG: STAS domain-containing protein [Lachnospiraceae bacterium]|nr:STAS domain-containing protein [Lachnospiraceae bacterium]
MEENIVIKEDTLIIRLPAEVDQYQTEKIRIRADELLRAPVIENVVFDFEKTEFMDSSGIGLIAGRLEKTACFGGKMMIINASARVKKILEMSGLGCLITDGNRMDKGVISYEK